MADAQTDSLFDPSGFSEGGFFDDKDVTVGLAAVVGGADTPMSATDAVTRCFIKVVLVPDVKEEGESDRIEYYSIGPLDKFTPSKDGSRIVYEPGTKMNKNAKASLFFAALINAGFPKSKLPTDANVKFLEGLHGHVNAMPMPEFKGKEDDKKKKKDGGPATVLVFTKLYDEPAKPGSKPKAAVQGAQTSAAAPQASAVAPQAGSEAAEVETVNALLGVLMQNGGSAHKRLLPTEVMNRVTDAKLRAEAFKLIGDVAWLGAPERPWAFDIGSGELKLR